MSISCLFVLCWVFFIPLTRYVYSNLALLQHRTEPTRHAELKESLALQNKLQRENEIFFTKNHSLEQSLCDEEDRRKTVEAELWKKEKKVKEMDEELDVSLFVYLFV